MSNCSLNKIHVEQKVWKKRLIGQICSIRKYVFDYPYLTTAQLDSCKVHTYKSLDSNPFNTDFAMPLVDKLLKHVPLWLSPNLLTLSTLFLSMANYFLLAYFDWEMYMSSYELPNDPIPNWVWFFCAINVCLCNLLDALDGKQARRVNACSPVGELLDHGTDSWRLCVPLLAVIFSLFGRAHFGIDARHQLMLVLCTQSVPFTTFWLQYLSGTLYYTLSSDVAQYLSAGLFLHTFMRDGALWWQCEGLYFGSNATIVEYFIYVTAAVSHLQLFYFFGKYTELVKGVDLSRLKRANALLVSPLILLICAVIWAIYSPNNILHEEPRTFHWLLSVVASDIAWNSVLSCMHGHVSILDNKLVFLYVTTVALSLYCASLEWILLTTVALLATVVHLHRAVSTIRQLCNFLNLSFSSLKTVNSAKIL